MTARKSEKKKPALHVHHNTMAEAPLPSGVDIHDNRIAKVTLADLRPKDRFNIGGSTYVLNEVHEGTATVTRMATRSNVTGYENGKPVLTEYEYGAQILDLPLDTEIE